MATSHDPKLTCQGGSCTEDPYLAAEAASEQPRVFECTAAHSHLTSSGEYIGPSLAELWGRTFKMSHDMVVGSGALLGVSALRPTTPPNRSEIVLRFTTCIFFIDLWPIGERGESDLAARMHAEVWGRTSKMSHDGTWRASCRFTTPIPPFHFGSTFHRTRRDKSRRWLWRLVRRARKPDAQIAKRRDSLRKLEDRMPGCDRRRSPKNLPLHDLCHETLP